MNVDGAWRVGTERGYGGAEGEGGGERGSQVGRLNDSHVTKPSRTVCVCMCVFTMHALV